MKHRSMRTCGRLPALLALVMLLAACVTASGGSRAENARWESQAARVTIVRDDWGIAHVSGKSDADAVFGMIYAQAEDDFNRIETNYLVSLGRLAEAEGEKAIWQDLRAKLYMQPEALEARYAASPEWLKRLMNAWADGLNFYLASHQAVRPRVITRFEPWMALSFSEGSIGGDIENIDLAGLESFYSNTRLARVAKTPAGREPSGSNGFAIAPSNSVSGQALLLINPHTSFFFRSELQMTSEEGLNAYGAATWGQFFIYQGFNADAGWMHTTSGVDVVDEFAETIVRRGDRLFYRYGREERPVQTATVSVRYRTGDGGMASRSFQTYRTHHGPIIRSEGGKWIAFAMMHKPVEALQQSFLRTKARDYASFLKVAELKANSSNNSIFADSSGNIAYLHPQFIPVRDDRFDYRRPVDGSDPATDWRGLHALADAPHLLNPPGGWIQNTNNWPYSAAGRHSPKRDRFPRYMDRFGENPRGLHALMVLEGRKDFTLERLRAAAYDSYMPAFAHLVPGLVEAWDGAPASNPLKRDLAAPVAALRTWDFRWAKESVPTSLAVFWGDEMWRTAAGAQWEEGLLSYEKMDKAPATQKLEALAASVKRLKQDFGRWDIAWGEINRFQRLTGAIVQPFADAAPSIAVGFPSARWGTLASFGAKAYPGTKRWYGTGGNSFVAVVEFGDRVRARAVTAGGESGDPRSPHFNDQAQRYADGDLREIHYYPDQLVGRTERRYHPGQ
ncbi:penicillin acylase family protein [Sphingosinicella rhizophila]|uniref:Penicillin acylase family protein n=1 Tax=Sphingosinicella rhizophila TaxID=3050082 RepID=A0ABU3Q6P9_9SPHN|nr:penicillin acylase family protein [Sphingosinicella sp. GR2756]MDT9599084.1 penicillin acylase family protein [Sphingosinicella sp. GR2756]